jgi:hypothetical protein
MTTQTDIAIGDCPNHGTVKGTRQLPRLAFPLIVTSIRRSLAKRRRPYTCPSCGATVHTD